MRFAPLPPNYTLLDPDKGQFQLPPEIVFDLVLSQNRLGNPSQFEIAASFSRSLNIPHINLEHCLPHPDWSRGLILRIKEMNADVNVFISDYSRKAWMMKESESIVIEHGIDTDMFRPSSKETNRKMMLLSVVNQWISRDWCCGFNFWREATKDLPCRVIGDTPKLSKPAETTDELIRQYQSASIFVNTSLISPVPTSLLEAMSCGCAVISTATCMIPEIITHNSNGLLASNPTEMRKLCVELLENPERCRELGDAARNTILKRFNVSDFVAKWNNVLLPCSNLLPSLRKR